MRRKVVASFTSRAARVRYDAAVQTSNSYVFNVPITERAQHGDTALPLLRPRPEADTKNQDVTNFLEKVRKNAFRRMPEPDQDVPDLEAGKAFWIAQLAATEG